MDSAEPRASLVVKQNGGLSPANDVVSMDCRVEPGNDNQN
jgi:hypothetical protein